MSTGNDLRDTLQQLCSDLLVPSFSSDDRRGILQSLITLTTQFPQAQSELGRLLADERSHASHAELPKMHLFRPLLVDISTTCLYDSVTSRSMLEFLAAFAEHNTVNQRRIARWVPGVRLSLDSFSDESRAKTNSKQHNKEKKELYILTVPKPVKKMYHKWRKRQRAVIVNGTEGRGTRIPSGVPPTQNGVPMPCYCDDCLGGEQLLATWYRHYRDLKRWTCKDENEGSAGQEKMAINTNQPVLTASDFFQMELTEYQLRSHKCNYAPKLLSDGAVQTKQKQAKVFYFAPKEESHSTKFDPNIHVCAIKILANVLDMTKQSSMKYSCRADSDFNPLEKTNPEEQLEINEDDDDGNITNLDKVVLFQDSVTINMCSSSSIPKERKQGEYNSVTTDREMKCEGLFDHVLTAIKNQYGEEELLSRGQLTVWIDSDACSSLLAESVQLILRHVLLYLSEQEQITFAALQRVFGGNNEAMCHLGDKDEVVILSADLNDNTRDSTGLVDAKLTVTALVTEQILHFKCIGAYRPSLEDRDTVQELRKGLFVGTVSQSEVCTICAVANTPFALLYLTDEHIQSLVNRCWLCWCSPIHLNGGSDRPYWRLMHIRDLSEEEHIEEDGKSEQREPGRLDAAIPLSLPEKKTSHLLPGLSDEAKQMLTRLSSPTVHTYQLSDVETINSLVKRLAFVIDNCNARINLLASARAPGLVNAKLAASNRCRSCRDTLIQLCKEISFERNKQAIATGSAAVGGAHNLAASRKRDLRFQSMVMTSIQTVLDISEQFDDWETPDERVNKLRLDRNVWGSGVPDFEFFRERGARATENKRRQRELSRKIQRQRQVEAGL